MKIKKITHFDMVNSTQDEANKQVGELNLDECIVVIANEQTAGKGTSDREWASPKNVNIYASYAYLVEDNGRLYLQNIPQVAAYSVVEVLQAYGFKPTYKWVNDVLLDGKKVCGILAQASNIIKNEKNCYAIVIGMGLNVNMTKEHLVDTDLAKLRELVTSMKMISSKEFDMQVIINQLNQRLINNLNILHTYGYSYFKDKIAIVFEKFNSTLQYFDVIDSCDKHEVVRAKVGGISPEGYLILDVNGSKQCYYTGRLLKDKEIEVYEKTLAEQRYQVSMKAMTKETNISTTFPLSVDNTNRDFPTNNQPALYQLNNKF